jgi:hypothetical protein
MLEENGIAMALVTRARSGLSPRAKKLEVLSHGGDVTCCLDMGGKSLRIFGTIAMRNLGVCEHRREFACHLIGVR